MYQKLENERKKEQVILSGNQEFYILGCQFIECSANGNGGGICISSSVFSLIHLCTFDSCQSTGSSYGGTVYVKGKNSNITKSSFIRSKGYLGSACYQEVLEYPILFDTTLYSCKGYRHTSGQLSEFSETKRVNGSYLVGTEESCSVHNWNAKDLDYSFLTYFYCKSKNVHDLHSQKQAVTSYVCVINCSESTYQIGVGYGPHTLEDSTLISPISPFGRFINLNGKAVVRNCFFSITPSVTYVTTENCKVVQSVPNLKHMCYLPNISHDFSMNDLSGLFNYILICTIYIMSG